MTSANIGTIVAIIALLITAGGVVGTSLRVGRNSQTVANYREAAASSEAKANAQKGQIEELQAAHELAVQEVTDLRAKVQVLQDMVTGKTAIEQLTVQVTEAFTRIDSKIVGRDAFEAAFRDLRTEVAAIGRQR
jgi:hypothetical protein